MSKKVFNPDQCPYEQLRKHRGHAIMYMGIKYSARGVERMRVVSHEPFSDKYGYHGKCLYARFFIDGSTLNWGVSCFAVRKEGYQKMINQMENYDSSMNREVLHIDFY